MEVKFPTEHENPLVETAEQCETAPDQLVREVMAGYVAGLADKRAMLDSRYDGLASGKVKPINGEEFFDYSACAKRS
jgi:hypothetical protein